MCIQYYTSSSTILVLLFHQSYFNAVQVSVVYIIVVLVVVRMVCAIMMVCAFLYTHNDHTFIVNWQKTITGYIYTITIYVTQSN